VGGAKKPKLVLDCIESWKKFCPDYEIKEWGDKELAQINNKYANEALAARKFAFASDVMRLYALKYYGGLYMDSDLLVTAPLDKFLDNHFFTGFEKWHNSAPSPLTALMGAQKDNPVICGLLAQYEGLSFIKANGEPDMTTNVARTKKYFLKKFGLKKYDGTKTLTLSDKNLIYPYYFFCVPQAGKENYAIHLFNGSWVGAWERKTRLTIGRLKVVSFKQLRPGEPCPLLSGERLLFKLPLRPKGRKNIAFTWKGKKL
jgi:hypothetical protein